MCQNNLTKYSYNIKRKKPREDPTKEQKKLFTVICKRDPLIST